MQTDDGVLTRFRDLLGSDSVESRAAVRAFTVDGVAPQCVLFPATIDDLARCTATADAAGLAVIPVGNCTQLGVGRVPRQYDVALSTRRLRRILAHEAADMTVTVEAGLTVAELNTVLAAAGQRLPLDPPHPEHTTIGALIACDASGPLRLSQGKVRDLLIGITVVLADGTVINGGGRVVKNVAGYDLMKLFTGSFGTLGIIATATFKVRPCPDNEAAFVIPAANTAGAVRAALDVLGAPLEPLSVEALNCTAAAAVGTGTERAAVVIGCGGAAEEVDVQHARLQAQFGVETVRVCAGAEQRRLSAAIRDLPSGVAALPGPDGTQLPEPPSPTRGPMFHGCTISVLPSTLADLLPRVEDRAAQCGLEIAALSHVGSGVVVVRTNAGPGGDVAFPPFAEWLRPTVRAADGWVVFDQLPVSLKDRIDPWGADIPALQLMRSIKQTLDPRNRLSPGRFVGGI
jgi:glycolate oxidase FAD binding subunit